jgi:hypothetical protein
MNDIRLNDLIDQLTRMRERLGNALVFVQIDGDRKLSTHHLRNVSSFTYSSEDLGLQHSVWIEFDSMYGGKK